MNLNCGIQNVSNFSKYCAFNKINDFKILIGLQNIRSLNNKGLEIKELINEVKFNIFCVTETWITGSNNDHIIAEAFPNNYKFYHKQRKSGKGGGVGIAIDTKLKIKIIENNYDFSSFEYIEGLITGINKSLRIVVIYRPPSYKINDFLNEFYQYLEILSEKNGKLILLGDFNIHVDKNNSYSNTFQSHLNVFNLINFISNATHIHGHVLDLVISDLSDSFIQNIKIHDYYNISDHFLITFAVNFESLHKNIIIKSKCRNLSLINIKEFSTTLSNHLNISIRNSCSLDDLLDSYNKGLISSLDKHAPVKERYLKKKNNKNKMDFYLSPEIIHFRKLRRKSEKKWKRYKNESYKVEFLKYRNKVINLIKKEKIIFYQNSFNDCKGNPKKIFNLINNLTKLNNCDYSDYSKEETRDIANKFAKHFIEKIEIINANILNQETNIAHSLSLNSKLPCTFILNTVSANHIYEIVHMLKCTTSYYDPISTKLLKNKSVLDVILPLITNIINSSISLGEFPHTEKNAIVKPFPKSKDASLSDLSKFRPISNLTYISKILEKVVSLQLNNYLESNYIFPKFQSGYRSFNSTETALLRIKNDVLKHITDGKCVLMVLLDLSAAFDTVNHDLLLLELQNIGLKNKEFNWFKSYLNERSQIFVVDGAESDKYELTCGVPQGSILGPILFLIYTRSLHKIFEYYEIQYHMYADDTQFYVAFDPENFDGLLDKVKNVMQDIKTWMSKKYLKLNEKKTEIIIYGSKTNLNKINKNDFKIDNLDIKLKANIKNIGCILDENLNMSNQINNTVKICNYHYKMIRSIRKYLNKETTIMLVHSTIMSRLDFHNSLVYNLPNCHLTRLQSVQNKAIRLIYKLRKRESISIYQQNLYWLPVKAKLEYKILLITHKCLTSTKPEYIYDLIEPDDKKYITLRNDNDLKLKRKFSKNNKSDQIFEIYSPILYNQLPMNIKTIDNINIFKKHVKKFLFLKYLM
ncbi:MAG TPA: hypothetical protein DDZ39_12280 [Flavobacteriaceae bacterium]|nr:hypothetical protein [Flavobacteriaceae bacterium]